jgi:hypothetical protein
MEAEGRCQSIDGVDNADPSRRRCNLTVSPPVSKKTAVLSRLWGCLQAAQLLTASSSAVWPCCIVSCCAAVFFASFHDFENVPQHVAM